MLEEDRVPCDELGLPRILAEDEARIEDEEEHGVGGGKLHYRTIEGYISAVAELYKIQVSLHKTPYPNFRGAAFSGKIESLKIQQDTRDRESFADRGLGGVVDSYTPEEYIRLERDPTKGYRRSRLLLLPPQHPHPRRRHLGLRLRPPRRIQAPD
ncbi:hypothetical protein BGZ57DRAFT_935856 [Hyaloscypha finlandica]|nr:hypothetical protein BGZ57DRAFT_935856 [Hyaloscypha finlandica]